ncbi:MAG: alpha-D-ribose 1-methylphosphonate 5-phosphate C-P-lyase PhnJ, partial [Parasphingopyxis sp.]
VSIRRFFQKTAGVAVTGATSPASGSRTRHRIPEAVLRDDQSLGWRVPIPMDPRGNGLRD